MSKEEGKTAAMTDQSPTAVYAVASVNIPAVSGNKSFLEYGFQFKLEEGFHVNEWGAAVQEPPTEVMHALVFEFDQNITIAKMFSPFRNIRGLCLTKHQIGEFLANNPETLRADAPLFLPFWNRNNGHFFVVKALLVGTEVHIKVLSFEDEREWWGRVRPRIVVRS